MRTIGTHPDLILHPIRVRIVYAIEGRALSSSQIALELSDVPQASLYRHIKKLHDAGVLVVARQRQVHGTVERIYEVNPSAVFVDTKKLVSDKNKSIRYFEIFLSCLRRAFATYAGQPKPDFKKDGVKFYSEFALLTDEEQLELNQEIRALILAAQKRGPEGKRRRRCLSYIAMPEPLSPHLQAQTP